MTEYIILDSGEDSNVLVRLIKFCQTNNFEYNIDTLFIGNYSTDLITVTVRNFSGNVHKLPGYNTYIPFVLEVPEPDIDQSALLAYMALFYNVNVISTTISGKESNKLVFYFEDGNTPFYLKVSNMLQYKQAFDALLGKKLVSTNPIFKDILEVKTDASIKRYGNYNIWYCDPRHDTTNTTTELN